MSTATVNTAPAAAGYDRAALNRFELFLVAAVTTVLITRVFLAATGYPQIGGSGGLHIAHVLWGGLLMAAAIVAVLIGDGSRVRTGAALAGGIGFGLFIDEVGKFVTADVDYFFQPAVAIMYVVFVLFYLVVREVVLRRAMSDRRRLAIGARALTDLTLEQLDDVRYKSALRALDEVQDPALAGLAESIRGGLRSQPPPTGGVESRVTRAADTLTRRTAAVLGHRAVRRTVLALFVLQAVVSLVSVIVAVVTDAPGDTEAEDVSDAMVQLSSTVTGALVVVGVWCLVRRHYLLALRLLRASVVIGLLLTQVFLFAQEEFGALLGFAVSLLLLAALSIAIRTEGAAVPAPA
ncbi:hypothetical protein [Rhodococcus sp. NPDC127528]|uniref:hypothetical protein n=1 Tax=unclassified Rhodococcus (in: high G+C Gram-positive bacteria) TaxID=192944 RepID=UPI0036350FCF